MLCNLVVSVRFGQVFSNREKLGNANVGIITKGLLIQKITTQPLEIPRRRNFAFASAANSVLITGAP